MARRGVVTLGGWQPVVAGCWVPRLLGTQVCRECHISPKVGCTFSEVPVLVGASITAQH